MLRENWAKGCMVFCSGATTGVSSPLRTMMRIEG